MEIRQSFLHPRFLHFVPLALVGVLLVLWPHFPSPFVAVMVVLFAGLEPQFNNILFRTPHELESMSVLPIEWEKIVVAKDIAALALAVLMFPLVAAALLYFSPVPLTSNQSLDALLFISTVMFPLVHVGNMRSVQHPRRQCGWQVDDVAGMVEFLISLAVLSLPFLIFEEVVGAPVLCIIYFIGTITFWRRYSIRKTAELIEARRAEICLAR